jgi:hypothetical protein
LFDLLHVLGFAARSKTKDYQRLPFTSAFLQKRKHNTKTKGTDVVESLEWTPILSYIILPQEVYLLV